jgi:hypothetical protein
MEVAKCVRLWRLDRRLMDGNFLFVVVSGFVAHETSLLLCTRVSVP